MPFSTGQTVYGRYRIEALLGEGGMGAVYRAYDLTLNCRCAVKVMMPPTSASPSEVSELRRQFQNEASILANLSHPSLPRVSNCFTWLGYEVLVMDFVTGQSLEARIEKAKGRGLDEAQVMTWAKQLLEALDYCHSRGVVHRDLKPANIITSQGRAVLVDFGLVKLWNPANPQTMTIVRGMGTPAYAPPEQYGLGTGHTEARSDIYSLGATLYHALTGQEPPAATQRIASGASLTSPRSLNSALNPKTEALILKAMELEKPRRYQSAGAMLAAVERVTGRSLLGIDPVGLIKQRPLLAVVAVVVLLLGGGVLLLGGGSEGTSTPLPTWTAVITWTATAEEVAVLTPPSPTSETDTPTPETPVPTPESPTPTPEPPSPTPEPPSPTFTFTPEPPSPADLQRELLEVVRWRTANGDPVFVPYVTRAPRLDGYLDEWTSAQYTIPYIVDQPENWSGPSDCSGTFYIAWDRQFLYLGVEVFDDQHVQESSGLILYKGDDIEIQIDTNLQGDYSDTDLSGDDGQIGFTVQEFYGVYESYLWRPTEESLDLDIAARQTYAGYVLEVAVPWWALNLNPRTETPYGFCLSLADDDSPNTKGQESMVSNVATRKWGNPTTWGTLILVDW